MTIGALDKSVEATAAYQTQQTPHEIKQSLHGTEHISTEKIGKVVHMPESKGKGDSSPSFAHSGKGAAIESKAEQKTDEQLKKALDALNKQLGNSEAIFGIHDKTNRVTIKIIDKTTKETIKEYPPERTLDMIAKIWELAGIMVDEKC